MKILYCNFDEEWHATVIKRISEELNAKTTISLSSIKHDLYDQVDNYIWINSDDVNYHLYKELYSETLPAVDGALIEDMLHYETLYMQMLDRNELDRGVSISFQKRKEYYYKDLRIMLDIINNYEPDVCLFSTIPHIGYDYLLYGLCKIKGIRVIIQYFGNSIPHKTASMYFLEDIFDHIPQLKEKDWSVKKDTVLSSRMEHYINHYAREKEEIVSFVHYSDYVKQKRPSILNRLEQVKTKLEEKSLMPTLKRKVRKRTLERTVNAYLRDNCCAIDEKEKYLYFPLHYQPEATSLPMAGYYYDQLLVIRLISTLLPDDVFLYVKPHPNRSWFADKHFYQQISEMKNVRLILDSVNTYDLIDNALAVVSLTGTVICEAVIRRKPVMMFGFYFWQYAPGVFHCISKNDCSIAIQKICSETISIKEYEVKNFLNEVDSYLIDGALNEVLFQIYDIPLERNIDNVVKGFINYYKNGHSKYF